MRARVISMSQSSREGRNKRVDRDHRLFMKVDRSAWRVKGLKFFLFLNYYIIYSCVGPADGHCRLPNPRLCHFLICNVHCARIVCMYAARMNTITQFLAFNTFDKNRVLKWNAGEFLFAQCFYYSNVFTSNLRAFNAAANSIVWF